MKKTEVNKISPTEFLKAKVGMLPSRDSDTRLHCPSCKHRTLTASFTGRKAIFICTSCRRSAAGLWEIMAKFDVFAPRTLDEAKARLDVAGVDYSQILDEAIFQSDVMQAEAAREREERQARLAARAARAAQ